MKVFDQNSGLTMAGCVIVGRCRAVAVLKVQFG